MYSDTNSQNHKHATRPANPHHDLPLAPGKAMIRTKNQINEEPCTTVLFMFIGWIADKVVTMECSPYRYLEVNNSTKNRCNFRRCLHTTAIISLFCWYRYINPRFFLCKSFRNVFPLLILNFCMCDQLSSNFSISHYQEQVTAARENIK